MIAYLAPAQFLGAVVMGVGLGIMLTRAYDAVQHKLMLRRIRRNVVAYDRLFNAPTSFADVAFKTSGPEAAPANRDPQQQPEHHDVAASPVPGVAVQSAATGEGAPPARSLIRPTDHRGSILHGVASDFAWQVDHDTAGDPDVWDHHGGLR